MILVFIQNIEVIIQQFKVNYDNEAYCILIFRPAVLTLALIKKCVTYSIAIDAPT